MSLTLGIFGHQLLKRAFTKNELEIVTKPTMKISWF